MKPVAYRIDGFCRNGDPAYYSPATFEGEGFLKPEHKVWPLYETPQPGCSDEVEVYYGAHFFVRPKHDYHDQWKNKEGVRALYLGPVLIRHASPSEVH